MQKRGNKFKQKRTMFPALPWAVEICTICRSSEPAFLKRLLTFILPQVAVLLHSSSFE
jgi:hypothetical protein